MHEAMNPKLEVTQGRTNAVLDNNQIRTWFLTERDDTAINTDDPLRGEAGVQVGDRSGVPDIPKSNIPTIENRGSRPPENPSNRADKSEP